MAPDMPMAMYNCGATLTPVCPRARGGVSSPYPKQVCSAVAAPNVLASSSMAPQCSDSYRGLHSMFASGSNTSPVAFSDDVIVVEKSAADSDA